jgi:hypothetical protein
MAVSVGSKVPLFSSHDQWCSFEFASTMSFFNGPMSFQSPAIHTFDDDVAKFGPCKPRTTFSGNVSRDVN